MNNVPVDLHTTARMPKVFGFGMAPKGLRRAVELTTTSDDPELHDVATRAPHWTARTDKRYLTMTCGARGARDDRCALAGRRRGRPGPPQSAGGAQRTAGSQGWRTARRIRRRGIVSSSDLIPQPWRGVATPS